MPVLPAVPHGAEKLYTTLAKHIRLFQLHLKINFDNAGLRKKTRKTSLGLTYSHSTGLNSYQRTGEHLSSEGAGLGSQDLMSRFN